MTVDDRNERAVLGLKEVFRACNSLSNIELSDVIFNAVQNEHRTIQQNFWRVMLEVIEKYSNTSYDLRNESSVKMCQSIMKSINENNNRCLPFI